MEGSAHSTDQPQELKSTVVSPGSLSHLLPGPSVEHIHPEVGNPGGR